MLFSSTFASYQEKFENIYNKNLCKYSNQQELDKNICEFQIVNKGLGTASIFILEESRKIFKKWKKLRKKEGSLKSILNENQSKILGNF